VTTATNGKEAIDALLAPDQNVDLILTDIMMPEVDGMELMRIVQASDKPFRSIPIIVMSTVDDDLVSAKCQEAGAQDYLVKPVRKSQMIDLSRHAQPSSSSEAGGSAWTEERALANGGANAADAQDGSGNTKRLSRISDRKVAAKQARTLTKARAAAKVASKLTEAAAAIAADNVAAAHWRGTPLVAAAAPTEVVAPAEAAVRRVDLGGSVGRGMRASNAVYLCAQATTGQNSGRPSSATFTPHKQQGTWAQGLSTTRIA